MRKGALYLVSIAAVAGAIFSWIALQHFMAVNGADLAPPSFCNINETMNCDVVAASTYATIGQYPVAGFGLVFFVMQLLLIAWAWIARESRGVPTVAFATALCGVAGSLYFVYIMTAVLQTFCVTCLAMDVAIALLVIGWLWTGGVSMRWNIIRKECVSPAITTVVMFVVGMLFLTNVGFATGTDKTISAAQLADGYAAYQRTPVTALDLSADHHPRWGSDNPKITIVEFSDFECPYCARAAFKIKPYIQEFKNDVQLVFVNYPLDTSCNKNMGRELHRNACDAARATLCANQQGKFWPVHDEAFRNQKGITKASLRGWAQSAGLNMQDYDGCIASPDTERWVQKDIALGASAKITGTPAVFLNGRKFSGWQSKEFLRHVINKELGR